jgi:hypothetical protein
MAHHRQLQRRQRRQRSEGKGVDHQRDIQQ